jgi:hypothetical protein
MNPSDNRAKSNWKPDALSVPWSSRACDLAAWTRRHLVNRTDVWGAYWPLSKRAALGAIYTAPVKRQRGQVVLSLETIARHYAGRDQGHLIGLHSTNAANTSLWGAIDIDCHGETSSPPEANLAAALSWNYQLVGKGFVPLLIASNGAGGYHLRVLSAEPVPTDRVYAWLQALTRDYRDYGMPAPPETFPKQPSIESGRFGNWLRLPGRHHTRDYWSEVWNGSRWLSGSPAIEHILSLRGDDPTLVPLACSPPRRSTPVPPPHQPQRTHAKTMEHHHSARIAAYASKLPNRGEGQHRDDIAYHFACWLVRDMQLPDEQALSWLEKWDAGNSPPKGTERLRQILSSAHAYGKHTYGCGLVSSRPLRVRSKVFSMKVEVTL